MEQFVVRLTEQDIDCGSNQNEEQAATWAERGEGEKGESRWGEVGQMICNALILRIITQIEIVE